MTRSNENEFRYFLDSMARCLLPDKTAVILNSEPKFGLTTIYSASAPQGVLAKLGFFAVNFYSVMCQFLFS